MIDPAPRSMLECFVAYSVSNLFQSAENALHGVVVGVEFDLAWAVKDNVVFATGLELLLEPVHVVGEIFHAVDDSTIRSKLKIIHGVFQ